jgi:hypothetical protein
VAVVVVVVALVRTKIYGRVHGIGNQLLAMKNNNLVSPTGWWIVSIMEKISSEKRVVFWNNHHLLRAEDQYNAFRKATKIGLDEQRVGNEAFSDTHEFMGVTNLIPLYNEIEDGVELFFEEYESEDIANESTFQFIKESDL